MSLWGGIASHPAIVNAFVCVDASLSAPVGLDLSLVLSFEIDVVVDVYFPDVSLGEA